MDLSGDVKSQSLEDSVARQLRMVSERFGITRGGSFLMSGDGVMASEQFTFAERCHQA